MGERIDGAATDAAPITTPQWTECGACAARINAYLCRGFISNGGMKRKAEIERD